MSDEKMAVWGERKGGKWPHGQEEEGVQWGEEGDREGTIPRNNEPGIKIEIKCKSTDNLHQIGFLCTYG